MFRKINDRQVTGNSLMWISMVTALCVTALVFCVSEAQAESVLKVGAYGGYF